MRSTKKTLHGRHFSGPQVLISGRHFRAFLSFIVAALGCLLIGREASAMFLNPEKEELENPRPAQAYPLGHPGVSSPRLDSPVAIDMDGQKPSMPAPPGLNSSVPHAAATGNKLHEQMDKLVPAPAPRRRVNSRAFARMSGQTDDFKPVTLPAHAMNSSRTSLAATAAPPDPKEQIFNIGSWAFVFSCLGGMSVVLLKIRKLTVSEPAPRRRRD